MNGRQRELLELLRIRFEEYLAAINYSPKTRVNYSRDVRVFLDWIAENTGASLITDITPAHLHQYQVALFNLERSEDGKRLSIGSQACKIAAIRSFFSWLLQEQQIAFNPATGLQMPQQPQRLPRNILTKKEARQLIEATPIEKPRDVRDRAILEVLYGSGIRRAEVISLTIYDVGFDNSTLRIQHGKGDRTRYVPLTQSAYAALKLYVEDVRGMFAREAGQTHLFVSSRSGGPLDDADIVRIVKKAAKRAGITKHITPHTLRHSCAIDEKVN